MAVVGRTAALRGSSGTETERCAESGRRSSLLLRANSEACVSAWWCAVLCRRDDAAADVGWRPSRGMGLWVGWRLWVGWNGETLTGRAAFTNLLSWSDRCNARRKRRFSYGAAPAGQTTSTEAANRSQTRCVAHTHEVQRH
eukprot:2503571-Rhodomonas_salina.1